MQKKGIPASYFAYLSLPTYWICKRKPICRYFGI